MTIRISHCSTSLDNYYLCLDKKVAGFINRGPKSGELIYLSVKVGKKSYCGARFILDEITDYKPWEDSERYVIAFTIKDIEYCNPFDLSILYQVGGAYWSLKYIQGAKPIDDNNVINLLDKTFNENKTGNLIRFEENFDNNQSESETDIEQENSVEDEIEVKKIINQVPEAIINIKSTFQTVDFINETDKVRGLEVLVNQNFHPLIYPEDKSILIPENRMFQNMGFRNETGENIQGIRSIPDAILITLDKAQGYKNPIQISLVEYECYGQKKTRSSDKLNYLNSQIIPQLMRFASAFSVTTDNHTRERNIQSWVEKIMLYITNEEQLYEKFIGWIRELTPDIRPTAIDREIQILLTKGFKTSLRVMLIIDDLSSEQKSMINNVINSFKLENGDSIQFLNYVVKLVQLINSENEYGLTVQ